MGGQGKTTLAMKVLDSKDVIGHFDCVVWITVSQSYDVEGLLRDMLLKFYKQQGKNPPDSIYQMDRGALTNEVRNYLQQKREDGMILSSSINEMQDLEKLVVKCRSEENYEVIDLDLISLSIKLQKLILHGILHKLPEWIPKLQNLVELKLSRSHLTEDPSKSLN
ncbi:putative disease resistance protein RGA3 [Trifolium pratense]|uniref:putative disease resistance protein RGA3 n=1 Tax=Trifolium pratense TaxID=57577 RepID=UPI001E694359|nr:putative disease resistance protein RGA3 [Trifolium pratense]